jgi:hypothetical protein
MLRKAPMQNDVRDTTLLSETKSACLSNYCPRCGKHEYVNSEQIIIGAVTVTNCHCRACDYSWHLSPST